MKIHAWRMYVWCWTPGSQLKLCCVLSYSQRLPKRTWPMPSWSWSSPTRLPKAFPPAPSMLRSSLRRTNCNSASYLISATPVIYETLDTKSLFLYFHLCLLCGGSPIPTASQVPSERYKAPLCKRAGAAALGQISQNKIFWVWVLSGEDSWFWDHPRRFSAEPNPFMFLLVSLGFIIFNLNFNLLPFLYLWYQAHNI